MKVLNEYPGSHHYWREFKKSEYFCPVCGIKEVYECLSGGDYYIGAEYICIACGAESYLDSVSKTRIRDTNYASMVEQIRSGITKEPTTPRGN